MYRGSGPPQGTFDFTPAFYQQYCPRTDVPKALQDQCKALDNSVTAHGYDKRINCFAQPSNAKCTAVLAAAKAKQDADIPKRNQCLKGEATYNSAQKDPNEKRTFGCNYSLLLLGGSPQKQWHILLPAACRTGTYVDPSGLDCCSADVRVAAENHPECVTFFPN